MVADAYESQGPKHDDSETEPRAITRRLLFRSTAAVALLSLVPGCGRQSPSPTPLVLATSVPTGTPAALPSATPTPVPTQAPTFTPSMTSTHTATRTPTETPYGMDDVRRVPVVNEVTGMRWNVANEYVDRMQVSLVIVYRVLGAKAERILVRPLDQLTVPVVYSELDNGNLAVLSRLLDYRVLT